MSEHPSFTLAELLIVAASEAWRGNGEVLASGLGNEEQTGILVLELDPVLEHAVVVAEMQATGRAHAGEDSFCVHVLSSTIQEGN